MEQTECFRSRLVRKRALTSGLWPPRRKRRESCTSSSSEQWAGTAKPEMPSADGTKRANGPSGIPAYRGRSSGRDASCPTRSTGASPSSGREKFSRTTATASCHPCTLAISPRWPCARLRAKITLERLSKSLGRWPSASPRKSRSCQMRSPSRSNLSRFRTKRRAKTWSEPICLPTLSMVCCHSLNLYAAARRPASSPRWKRSGEDRRPASPNGRANTPRPFSERTSGTSPGPDSIAAPASRRRFRLDPGQRGGFVLGKIEDRIKPHHLQQHQHAFAGREVRALSPSPLQVGEGSDERPDSRAVQIGHPSQIDGHVGRSGIDQLLNLRSEA